MYNEICMKPIDFLYWENIKWRDPMTKEENPNTAML